MINRVTKTLYGRPQFFGVIETWWEDKEAMNKDMQALKATRHPNGNTMEEHFSSQVGKAFSVLVEEFIVNHWRSRFKVCTALFRLWPSSIALNVAASL